MNEPTPTTTPATGTALLGAAREYLFNVLAMVFDKQAAALIIPPAAILGYIDMPKLMTLLEWMLYAAVIAGFAIQISRVVFPQIVISKLLEKAAQSGPGSATIVASIVLFVGALMISLAFWTKP